MARPTTLVALTVTCAVFALQSAAHSTCGCSGVVYNPPYVPCDSVQEVGLLDASPFSLPDVQLGYADVSSSEEVQYPLVRRRVLPVEALLLDRADDYSVGISGTGNDAYAYLSSSPSLLLPGAGETDDCGLICDYSYAGGCNRPIEVIQTGIPCACKEALPVRVERPVEIPETPRYSYGYRIEVPAPPAPILYQNQEFQVERVPAPAPVVYRDAVYHTETPDPAPPVLLRNYGFAVEKPVCAPPPIKRDFTYAVQTVPAPQPVILQNQEFTVERPVQPRQTRLCGLCASVDRIVVPVCDCVEPDHHDYGRISCVESSSQGDYDYARASEAAAALASVYGCADDVPPSPCSPCHHSVRYVRSVTDKDAPETSDPVESNEGTQTLPQLASDPSLDDLVLPQSTSPDHKMTESSDDIVRDKKSVGQINDEEFETVVDKESEQVFEVEEGGDYGDDEVEVFEENKEMFEVLKDATDKDAMGGEIHDVVNASLLEDADNGEDIVRSIRDTITDLEAEEIVDVEKPEVEQVDNSLVKHIPMIDMIDQKEEGFDEENSMLDIGNEGEGKEDSILEIRSLAEEIPQEEISIPLQDTDDDDTAEPQKRGLGEALLDTLLSTPEDTIETYPTEVTGSGYTTPPLGTTVSDAEIIKAAVIAHAKAHNDNEDAGCCSTPSKTITVTKTTITKTSEGCDGDCSIPSILPTEHADGREESVPIVTNEETLNVVNELSISNPPQVIITEEEPGNTLADVTTVIDESSANTGSSYSSASGAYLSDSPAIHGSTGESIIGTHQLYNNAPEISYSQNPQDNAYIYLYGDRQNQGSSPIDSVNPYTSSHSYGSKYNSNYMYPSRQKGYGNQYTSYGPKSTLQNPFNLQSGYEILNSKFSDYGSTESSETFPSGEKILGVDFGLNSGYLGVNQNEGLLKPNYESSYGYNNKYGAIQGIGSVANTGYRNGNYNRKLIHSHPSNVPGEVDPQILVNVETIRETCEAPLDIEPCEKTWSRSGQGFAFRGNVIETTPTQNIIDYVAEVSSPENEAGPSIPGYGIGKQLMTDILTTAAETLPASPVSQGCGCAANFKSEAALGSFGNLDTNREVIRDGYLKNYGIGNNPLLTSLGERSNIETEQILSDFNPDTSIGSNLPGFLAETGKNYFTIYGSMEPPCSSKNKNNYVQNSEAYPTSNVGPLHISRGYNPDSILGSTDAFGKGSEGSYYATGNAGGYYGQANNFMYGNAGGPHSGGSMGGYFGQSSYGGLYSPSSHNIPYSYGNAAPQRNPMGSSKSGSGKGYKIFSNSAGRFTKIGLDELAKGDFNSGGDWLSLHAFDANDDVYSHMTKRSANEVSIADLQMGREYPNVEEKVFQNRGEIIDKVFLNEGIVFSDQVKNTVPKSKVVEQNNPEMLQEESVLIRKVHAAVQEKTRNVESSLSAGELTATEPQNKFVITNLNTDQSKNSVGENEKELLNDGNSRRASDTTYEDGAIQQVNGENVSHEV